MYWPLWFFEGYQQLIQFVFQVISAQLEFFATPHMRKINHMFKCFRLEMLTDRQHQTSG